MTKKKADKGSTPKEPEVKEKNKVGRPSIYSTELAIEFCEDLRNFSTVEQCCNSKSHYPHPATIFDWSLHNQEFSELYKKANRIRYAKWAEDCLNICDDDSKDLIENPLTGELKSNTTAVTRSALRVNTRMGLLKKLQPEIFGDKIAEEENKTFNLILSKEDLKL